MEWFSAWWGCDSGDNQNWYCGASGFGLPKTNNSIESFNNILKTFVTCRNRLTLTDLVKRLVEEISYQSSVAKQQPFLTCPTSHRAEVVSAQEWLKETKRYIVTLRNGDFLVPSDSMKRMATSEDTPGAF